MPEEVGAEASQNGPQNEEGLSAVTRVRKEFPETWLWSKVISGYFIILYMFESLWYLLSFSCTKCMNLYMALVRSDLWVFYDFVHV